MASVIFHGNDRWTHVKERARELRDGETVNVQDLTMTDQIAGLENAGPGN